MRSPLNMRRGHFGVFTGKCFIMSSDHSQRGVGVISQARGEKKSDPSEGKAHAKVLRAEHGAQEELKSAQRGRCRGVSQVSNSQVVKTLTCFGIDFYTIFSALGMDNPDKRLLWELNPK